MGEKIGVMELWRIGVLGFRIQYSTIPLLQFRFVEATQEFCQ